MQKDKKEALKGMIKRLHDGEDPDKVKEEFEELLKDTSPTEIAQIEDEIVKEGMPREDLHKLCDVHLAMFKDKLDAQETIAPEGHPIHILMEEHKLMLQFAEKLRGATDSLAEAKDLGSAKEALELLGHVLDHLKESEKHYLREENVLFPYLDKHGIKEPPAIMWMEHDKIREVKKGLYELYDGREKIPFEELQKRLKGTSITISEIMSKHFFKENKILFPAALKTITDEEWPIIRNEFDDVGYCCFTPEADIKAGMGGAAASAEGRGTVTGGKIDLGAGAMTPDQIRWIFNSMPVDVTFVDKDDRVGFFSETKDRLFVRSRAIIGRKVQMCHPQKSVHVVEKILSDFKEGKRDVAEFYLTLGGKFIHIRYFAVRNDKGEYLGTLEVSQDLTDIRKMEGEKRLLD